ncbi:hypothetical protein Syun_010881 [Stephania yunnanensis]|uniref:Uncharacterized protein n=1 Tax=Stephania yunnanensis TaxID=152371 RepID=A0AAP0JWR3_9MAGN
MESSESDQKSAESALKGFSAISETRIYWNSRKRSASREQKVEKVTEDIVAVAPDNEGESPAANDIDMDSSTAEPLSERRRALFEPLEPMNGRRLFSEELLPPPDFDAATYPKGWLIGKKRKLVNVDVVESMRRIAVQEMNRKDREINGLNEQLEEDAKALEHLQLQLLQERSKRSEVERENTMLQNQVSMLMNMLQEPDEEVEEEGTEDS